MMGTAAETAVQKKSAKTSRHKTIKTAQHDGEKRIDYGTTLKTTFVTAAMSPSSPAASAAAVFHHRAAAIIIPAAFTFGCCE